MSNHDENALQRREMAPPVRFRHSVQNIAAQHYGHTAQTEAGRRIVSRFAMAFATAARGARNPAEFYNADPASVAAAAALSLDTGLLPGGAMPAVWLVPRRGQLQWLPSHRGLVQLCQEAGYQIRAVPVGPDDEVEIVDGELSTLRTSPDYYPAKLSDLRGVAVYVTRITDGARFASWWLPRAAIEKRAKVQGAGPVWRSWPVEMAMKTAIKWGFARGMVPVASIALDAALTADREGEQPDRVEVTVAPSRPASPAALLGLQAPATDAEGQDHPAEPQDASEAPEAPEGEE